MSSKRDAVPTKSIIKKNPKRYSCAAQRTHSTCVAASGPFPATAGRVARPIGDRSAQLEPDRTGSWAAALLRALDQPAGARGP